MCVCVCVCVCVPVLCVSLHLSVSAAPMVSLSCLSSLMYHPLVWGMKPWEHRHFACDTAAVTVRGLLRVQTDSREDSAFVCVYHREVSRGNLSVVPSSPSHHPSVPHPSLSHQASRGGGAGKLWLHCFLWHRDPLWDLFTSSFYRMRVGAVKKYHTGPEW